MKRILYNAFAFLIAFNYFAFRVELFDREFREHHPPTDARAPSLLMSSLTWESFDKDNAPEAFAFIVSTDIECLAPCEDRTCLDLPTNRSLQPVRDKSPPPSER